jgi:hypothetical protein
MSYQLYRAGGRRDPADEYRAIAAPYAPSTKELQMPQHYSSVAEAGELGMLAYGYEPLRQVLRNGWRFADAAYR